MSVRIHSLWLSVLAAALGGVLADPAATHSQPAKEQPAHASKPGAESKQPAPAKTAATRSLVVRVPAGGRYLAWIQEAAAAPVRVAGDRATLDLDPTARAATVLVLDEATGYAARRTVNPKQPPPEIAFAGTDFTLVHRLVIQVTGQDNKPLARGRVTVQDRFGRQAQQLLEPDDAGRVEFHDLPAGAAQVTVVPEGGSATVKVLELAVPRGETAQTYLFAIPEATAVLDAATNAPAASAPASSAGTVPAGPASPGPPAPATSTAPPGAPLPPPPASDPLGALLQAILGFAVLAGLIYAGIAYCRRQNVTLAEVLAKLGVRPDGAEPGGSAAVAEPQAAPPPPVVADPNCCPFCGEQKDAAGNCACSLGAVSPGAPASALATPAEAKPFGGQAPVGAGSNPGAGPRLIGLSGPYLGHVFPITGDGSIGRDGGNAIALEQDTTVSRRHAVLTALNGSYLLRDQGSSNGTFVNGARVTECPVQPGDEIGIGGTRFRFEV